MRTTHGNRENKKFLFSGNAGPVGSAKGGSATMHHFTVGAAFAHPTGRAGVRVPKGYDVIGAIAASFSHCRDQTACPGDMEGPHRPVALRAVLAGKSEARPDATGRGFCAVDRRRL